jgi:hypothetical protein
MPPYAQDAFTAAHEALQSRWLDVLMTGLSVAFEPWILALIALALFSWLERDVPSVLRSFLPLLAALAVAVAGGVIAGAGPFGGQALATSVFASYGVAARPRARGRALGRGRPARLGTRRGARRPRVARGRSALAARAG